MTGVTFLTFLQKNALTVFFRIAGKNNTIMRDVIVIFKSTHDVIKAERLCEKENIACRIIPVPRSISFDCGIALEINLSDKDRVEQLLASDSLHPEFRPMG